MARSSTRRGRGGGDRTVTKKCLNPACSAECPVARRTCQCGYQFPTKTRNVAIKVEPPSPAKDKAEDSDIIDGKRRTFRTKRMRPDFFNPLDVEYSSRRKVKVPEVKKKRGRPKGSLNKPNKPKPEPAEKPTPEDENMFANIPAEKMLQFNIILQELNHKFIKQNFKPPE